MKKLLLISILMLISSSLLASIDCNGGNDFSTIMCTNNAPGYTTMVRIKKMPSWGGNAGLTVVDICNRKDGELPGDVHEEDGIVYSTIPQDDIDESKLECVHRYCSSDSQYFGILLNGIPIPVAPAVFFRLGFGFFHRTVEVRCETLSL
jgi:hypothetical protein